jgi:histidine triad (HIT) family protein
MDDCVFCKVIRGELPSEKIRETENLIVIKDIEPQADLHLLIIPKEHVGDVTGLSESTWSEIKKVGLELIKQEGIKDFRMETNAGDAALIKHMHMHLLGKVSANRKL